MYTIFDKIIPYQCSIFDSPSEDVALLYDTSFQIYRNSSVNLCQTNMTKAGTVDSNKKSQTFTYNCEFHYLSIAKKSILGEHIV